ncbi:MAG: DegT/DnrJ/EryC1/StrS family aminotransferase [Cyclobacteriaceae bacterium]|nr:DegT/DnrJ/EryC1/StrS family aminotransferase [Cyclobacteriaceae bacterium]UYN88577.1 MAG: DegT/DnrJ/EryC1/StrS family aminotransferase [Cyclobacteriaceae bacterium]
MPFSPPYIDEDVKREVLDALQSGWITSGPKVLALEKLVAEQTGLTHVACCNSATSGLMLLLHWYGITRGDEVIIPAYTYAATALVVIHLGATPVMVDSGPDFNIDIDRVAEKITSRTKAIIPVDIAGWPCNYKKLFDLVNAGEVKAKFNPQTENQRKLGRIMVLSDAAHSLGAKYSNRPIGTWGDFSVFSFHAVKNVTTAEGGAMCINLPENDFDRETIYRTLKLWSLNGQTKDALAKTNGAGWKYDIVYPGFKMNMPDVCAAIGLAQLRKYKSHLLTERKRVADAYSKAFSQYAWAELPPLKDSNRESSYHVYPLRIRGITENQRDQMIEKISETGVSVNVHFQPLPLLTVFGERGYKIQDYPVAYDCYSREISLPIYPELDQNKINYIVQAVVQAYGQLNDHA